MSTIDAVYSTARANWNSLFWIIVNVYDHFKRPIRQYYNNALFLHIKILKWCSIITCIVIFSLMDTANSYKPKQRFLTLQMRFC